MMTPQFTHLRLHSEYSIVDGLVRIDEVVAAAQKDGQPAIALTDLSNLFGMIKFYRAARSHGVKPIVGCDVWITNEDERDKPSRLLLLVKNKIGYLQICELLTRAWLTNNYRGRAEVRIEWLEELQKNNQGGGLIALSGAHFGNVGMAIDNGNLVLAKRCLLRWMDIFPDHFYVEVQRADQANMALHVVEALNLAAQVSVPVVATHPIEFLSPDEFTAHEARTCIAQGEILANARRPKRFMQTQCFKTQEEMAQLFADIPAALYNSVEIAKRCNLILELDKPRLPDFPIPSGISEEEFLEQETHQGLERRLCQLYPDAVKREEQRGRYEERLKFETQTIVRMGFAGYFLIVAEFIRWAKENGVPVGPGRGSGAGSLVAYALRITDLDPLAYNLLFERFLNPDRVSMPDFDIDFCQEGRDRVIAHVKELYGKEAVSQIATFGTMAAKGAIRDVGRVLDLSYHFCDGISKLIPFKPGKHVTIADAIKEEPILAERLENEEEVKQLISLAQQVEGIVRNVGMHAGGVLIAPGKLTDFCPLYTQGGDSGVVSQFDKDDVEAIGLVKFDFLGLTTLTILDRAVRYIKQLDQAMADFNLETIPLNDRPAYQLLCAAKTVAVFQLESRGMQSMLKDARPDRFEDIIALVALYRPGPMDLIPDFCRRKHGERFDYPDPRTEGILSETYGIMVYQEQVMQMAQVIGGYSLGGADLLRRAMGKKKAEEMAEHREIFRKGAAEKGLSVEKADEIFDLMEKFAGYGFNKSHAAAYALLSYHTAFLKAHHPAAFMAANLSLAMDDTDKIKILVIDAQEVCGLTLLPPDVNRSDYYFVPEVGGDGIAKSIRYGLGAIKGSGQNAIEAIIKVRADQPFTDIFDFCLRVDKRHINRRTIESLIRSGAFDCFNVDRAIMLATVGRAMENAEQALASINQASLFDDDVTNVPCEHVAVAPWSDKERLMEEKAALGFYLSGHMFDVYAKEAKQFSRTTLAQLTASRDPRYMVGVIVGLRSQMTQRGRMLVVSLDDGSAVVDVTIYSELLEAHKDLLKEEEFLAVYGKASEDRFSGGLRIVADQLLGIAHCRIKFARSLKLNLNTQADISLLSQILLPHCRADGCAVVVQVQGEHALAEVKLDDAWRVYPNDVLLQQLRLNFSGNAVCMEYV